MTALVSVPTRSAGTESMLTRTIVPVPDARPPAVRWHRTPDPGASMSPLPLSPDETGSVVLTGPEMTEAELAVLRRHAYSLLGALVDAIQGRRPLAQLTRWVSDEVMAAVALRVRLHQRAPEPWSVRSLHIQVMVPAVAEVAARLQVGPRFAAVALRLEHRGARWFCPIADFGPVTEAAQRRL